MVSRGKKSYLNLIHHVLHLLNQETRLKYEITHDSSNLDGLLYHRGKSYNRNQELKRIQATIQKICLTHEDLVDLLRERIQLKDTAHLNPQGNAGYYRQVLVKEALELNKNRIGEIINPSGL